MQGMQDDPVDFDTWIRTSVEVADAEYDHVQIVALSDALRVPLKAGSGTAWS